MVFYAINKIKKGKNLYIKSLHGIEGDISFPFIKGKLIWKNLNYQRVRF